ncbi:MAG TPA: hypothetical protein VHO67_04740 [Polyangia bacterium]|nr:hypothetical protein [Polyangia bacterium]
MTAEQVIAMGRQALADDRDLTAAEFQAVRDALAAPSTDQITRGTLQGLGAALTDRSNRRLEAMKGQALEEALRERKQRVQARRERWRALSPIVRAAHLSGDQRLLAFARLCEQNTAETRPADTFEPENSPRSLGLGEPG